jgi:alkaline phosphatase D
MKNFNHKIPFFIFIIFISCNNNKEIVTQKNKFQTDFTIAFGSCNKQYKENILWPEIAKNNPNVWVWGGDNIYANTKDFSKLKEDYSKVEKQKGYLELVNKIPVLATWDDHDYGYNDSGADFFNKIESQKQHLDFFKIPENSPRRKQEGIYNSKIFKTKKGTIKVIVLDTRYFRTALTKSNKTSKKRYIPNTYGEGTVLGKKQWSWLTNELYNSKADFNIIVSSIQFLSSEHGYETWGNFPHEVDKLKKIIKDSKSKGVALLSGDRHISEFSITKIKDVNYPLIDFTSSGLTHAYSSFPGEANKFRIKNVVTEISFGLLKFDFNNGTIAMEMRGKENKLLQKHIQKYH